MMGKNVCSDPLSSVWPVLNFRVVPLSLTKIDETIKWPSCSEKVIKLWVSSRRVICARDKASRESRIKLYNLDAELKCISTI